ncbi:hypothetical protein COV19_00730 [Candidatus Woesearchaeota archaeon CG10_big_fil_rev_8_21_14_0_10_44_13]|nr:MAG: hypothetical protein COV19_00730 [Candidatus Woesearchaeota archaeon CG10_big_fil_rev_8_21_14_0_10_44_13]
MNEQIIYPSLLIIGGILISTMVIIILTRFSNKIMKFFELYPESKGILNLSLRFISWFVGLIILLIFVRLALRFLNLEFTMKITEDVIKLAPKYILAALLVLAGFYATRLIRERSKDYKFELKERILLVIYFIVHMTFIFTALYTIGVNVTFFLEFYKVVLWIIGAIIALVISMTIGIPLGMSIHEKIKKERKHTRK